MGKKYLDTKKGSLESSILGVWQNAIEEGDARMDGRTKQYREHRKKLESARARRVNKEEVELDEKPADFIRLSFKSPADVKKAKKWMDQNLPGANQGFTGMDASGKDIEFEDVDDAEDLMAKLKKAGFKFKMDYREEVTWGNAQQFKIQSMKAALAKVWGMEEGHNPFAEHKGTKPHKHPHEEDEKEMVRGGKTETGKKPAAIDLKPKINEEAAEFTEGRMKELHGYIAQGKSAKEIAKIMKVDVKTIKALM